MDYTTLVNYGAMGVCLAYFMWTTNNTMKDLKNALEALTNLVNVMNVKLDVKEVTSDNK